MPKQNQILAIEKGLKTHVYSDLSAVHAQLQKQELLQGLVRSYKPIDDDGEKYPNEEQRVQLTADAVIKATVDKLVEYFDVVATKDFTNCEARADIVIDEGTAQERILATAVPATYLLWLEKQLNDMHTFVSKLPTLAASHKWEWDEQQDCWRSQPSQTVKKKKIPRAFVKAEATREHPAQVEVVHEDKLEGYWTSVSFSGAMPATWVAEMRERVEKLQKAVKWARERANNTEAKQQKIGDTLLRYLFPVGRSGNGGG